MFKKTSFFTLVFVFSLFFVPKVFAADPKLTIKDPLAYSAKYISQSVLDPITIEAGSKKTVTVRFKNTGTETWNEKGSNYLSAYTVEPKYRNSPFAAPTWKSKSQTSKMKGIVKPGATGEISIDLTAPTKAGEYTEEFHLAAENMSWVEKGYFFLKIKVVPKKGTAETPKADIEIVEPVVKPVEKEPYDAKRVLQSQKEVSAEGGEQIKLIVSFENTGSKQWKDYSIIAPELGSISAGEKQGNFGDDTWKSERVVIQKKEKVDPKEVIKETFYIRAPKKKGEYTARFVLQADGTPLTNAIAEVNIDVTKNAPKHYKEPNLKSDTIAPIELFRIKEEPRIRVGVFKLEQPEKADVDFISTESDYHLYDGTKLLYTLPKGQTAELSYTSGEYKFKSGKQKFIGTEYFRLSPVESPHAVFSVPNLERTIEWHKGMNFDSYRGAMEYRLTDDKKTLYVINDLFIEDYMYGIAETSNGTHIEYIKALQTAARTYAYYVTSQSDKYPNGNFDVVGHTGDQLYLGYKNEALRPRVVQSTNETRGYFITYDLDNNIKTPNQVVITPYFGNTDGKTRSWSQVWGGSDKPWLVSVKADYDKRDKKKMYGHGVGMSQRDAMIRADAEQLDFKQLLKYYYTGVKVEKLYQ